ncbi:MAG: hypothetical protein E7277_01440 [Lachnospiraceae bacterium]|nr:hypothetical protein [Lachnospiraceae bacterium]
MLSENNEIIEISLEKDEMDLIGLIAKRYYDEGYRNGFDKGRADARIEDISTLIKRTGQEIFARKSLDASHLELKYANQRIGLAQLQLIEDEIAFEASQNARLGEKSLRDWQWL